MKTSNLFNQRILSLLLLSFSPLVLQVLGMEMEKRGVQSQATCMPNYGWMDNSVQQSPCYVAGWLLGQCNEGSWTVFANTDPNVHYNTPNATTANQCSCSWAVYNTLQACALCQDGFASTVSTWTQWSTNCSNFLSSPNPWPKGTVIPNETAIPFWATTDPNTWPDAKFDGPTAQDLANENKPEITNATFNGPASSSSSHSAPVGAIAGGVVGGVLLLALLALGLFYLSCRRRSAAERRARARGVSVLSLTTDAQHARTPSDGTTTTTLFGFGPGVGRAGQKYGVPGFGYLDGGRGGGEREFTSPLMSGTPESGGGVSMMSMTMSPAHQQRPVYQHTPSFGASTSTSMLMAPGTTPSPAPVPVPGFGPNGAGGGPGMLPPGMVNMSVSPMMGVANPNSSMGGTAGAGGSVNVSAPHSPPNPSVNNVSFASATRPGLGHEHSGSNSSGMSGVYSGHGHSFSIAGSGEGELPEGAISPFIFPQEDSTTTPPADDPFGASTTVYGNGNTNANKGSPGTGAGAGAGAGFGFASSTPLRKPHEPRARINPPAYSPTASPEESMFASGRPHLRSTSLSFTIGGDTLASNEATGAESSMGLSGTTLGSGARSAAGGAETLQGTVRSPSPVDEAGEPESGRERDGNGFIVDQKI